jgi:hypothetical protein
LESVLLKSVSAILLENEENIYLILEKTLVMDEKNRYNMIGLV